MSTDPSSCAEPHDPELAQAEAAHEETRRALVLAARATLRTHVQRAVPGATHLHLEVAPDDGDSYLAGIAVLGAPVVLEADWTTMEEHNEAAQTVARSRGEEWAKGMDYALAALPEDERTKVLLLVPGRFEETPLWAGIERLWYLIEQPSGLVEL